MERSRVLLTFLDEDDEALIWQELTLGRPQLALVDGSRWPSSKPPLAGSPSECRSRYLFIWDQSAVPVLPAVRRGDMYDGPQSGQVIQWQRCVRDGDELRSGRLAIGYETTDAALPAFVELAFDVVERCTTRELRRLDGQPERDYRVGPNTFAAAHSGLHLRDGSVPFLYFRPTTAPD